MLDLLLRPWPWYVAGPLLGAVTVALLLVGNRALGMSGTFRSVCAIVAPRRVAFFHFDWRGSGGWNLVFAAGVALGGFVGVHLLGGGEPAALSAALVADLQALGITDLDGLLPADLFSWQAALGVRGLLTLVLGGFLVGFGASYAGGCTSGHGILGLADLQPASFVAVAGFFAGGLVAVHLVLPLLL